MGIPSQGLGSGLRDARRTRRGVEWSKLALRTGPRPEFRLAGPAPLWSSASRDCRALLNLQGLWLRYRLSQPVASGPFGSRVG
jgi:hypothetical protein